MIKAVFAEQVLRILNGGDYASNSKVKERDVFLAMEQARNYLIEKHLNMFGEDISDEFVSVYDDVVVKRHSKRDRYYIELPAQLVSLREGRGLRQISPLMDEYDVWIPMKSGNEGLFHGLEAGNLGGKIGYWMEGPQQGSIYPVVVFNKNMGKEWEGKEVLLKMIASIDDLDEDEAVPVPASVEMEMLQLVLSILSGQKQMPQNKVNDNNDNTTI